MKPFVFSADSHIMEPADIFLEGLPPELKRHAIHARKEGEYLITGTAEKTIKVHRSRLMEKMQVPSLADLVRAATRLGLD